MKYSIYINQLKLNEISNNLDIKDAGILSYCIDFCSADDKNTDQLDFTENGIKYRYTWINYNHLIKEMPLLKFKQTSSITQRIKKLTKAGLIKSKTLNSERLGNRKVYIRLTEKVKELFFSSGDQLIQISRPTNVDLLNNNIIEQIILHRKSDASSSSLEENKENKAFSLLMSYFYNKVEQIFGFKPQIDAGDGQALKKVIKKYKKSEEIEDIIDFYLKSDKAEKTGITLKACFSTHTLNLFEQKGRRSKFL